MKQKKKKVSYKTCLFLAFTIVVLDWIFQWWFRSKGVGVANAGVSFGFGSEMGWFWQSFLLTAFLLYVAYLLWWKVKINVFLACLLIGGLGNLLPRVFYGNVWDYLSLSSLGLWINVSDVLISLSVLSYILIADESSYSFRK